jgi:hypothetical protein
MHLAHGRAGIVASQTELSEGFNDKTRANSQFDAARLALLSDGGINAKDVFD